MRLLLDTHTFLWWLADDPSRHLILLTATPHQGNDDGWHALDLTGYRRRSGAACASAPSTTICFVPRSTASPSLPSAMV